MNLEVRNVRRPRWRRREWFVRTLAISAVVPSFVSGGTAFADDSAMSGLGGTVTQLKPGHTQVRMVSELVKVLDPIKGTVDATFVFRNEGKAQDVLMGFPEYAGGDSPDDGKSTFKNFRCSVDGKSMPVHRQSKPIEDRGDFSVIAWWTKTVHFDAGETHIVRDQFTGGNAGNSAGNRWFTYVLSTGANWKGPIGHVQVEVDPGQLRSFAPVWYHNLSASGNKFVLDKKNMEPTEKDNITIDWFPAFLDVSINQKAVLPADRRQPENVAFDQPYWHNQNQEEGPAPYPVLRGDSIWLAADTAADWLGAKMETVTPSKDIKIIRGDRWLIIKNGSNKLSLSGGSTVDMPYTSRYEKGLDDPRLHLMVSLSSIVSALGGTCHLDRAQPKFVISMPPAK